MREQIHLNTSNTQKFYIQANPFKFLKNEPENSVVTKTAAKITRRILKAFIVEITKVPTDAQR